MKKRKHRAEKACVLLLGTLLLCSTAAVIARAPSGPSSHSQPSPTAAPKKPEHQDDSLSLKPAKDLILRPEGERKAEALAHFVDGASFEENGEMDKALEAYRKVL